MLMHILRRKQHSMNAEKLTQIIAQMLDFL